MGERTCRRCTAALGEEHRPYCSGVGLVTEGQLEGISEAARAGAAAGLEGRACRPRARREEVPEQVHLVGPDLRVGDVQRQRCVWCGALILEHDLANMAMVVEPGEEPRPPATWAVGALVLVTGTAPRVSTVVEPVLHPDGLGNVFSIPENSCMALDPEVTR